ncbi:MAG: DoxX family membrane protein [Candidatus Marinimicrobia bacterium]|nr:DoxX family membrane protein [Candidatus Neomarinimicrobiota bacterium]
MMNKKEIGKFTAIAILSFVFVYSAWTKIIDPEYFVISISYYRLFPMQPMNFAAIFLIMIEVLAGIGLWVPKYRRSASLLIAGMMLFFIVIIGISMARGLDISCGCFGEGSGKIGLKKILENSGLLALTVFIFFTKNNYKKI